jgi:hypothetical protein
VSQLQGWLYALGAVITLAGSYVVARVGARVSRHATDTTAALTEEANALAGEANAVAGFHSLVGDLQVDLARLRVDHNALRVEHDRLGEHVKVLEKERAKDKALIRNLIGYARLLIATLRTAGMAVPDPPAGIDTEL